MVMFAFSVLDWKYHFRENLTQKFKIIFLRWNWSIDQFDYAELDGDIQFFCFKQEIHSFGQIRFKNSKLSF